ncbi:hypothetical protein HYH03_005882 [Edaphochlamys debaryana]|uniref:50S ribosomal protein L22, chloroplastic n=1 Tax=Edaphochlamys debaryana TaxID=47281 RepID=A0A835Y6F6_9CHLO|nr:hypothetical protein HYH03_005882 [Edaphochlamys debaryana]|eukprot:KAG2495952.1 hypothetical protein HYH03_005882 [Edaphochlamys debaryana]
MLGRAACRALLSPSATASAGAAGPVASRISQLCSSGVQTVADRSSSDSADASPSSTAGPSMLSASPILASRVTGLPACSHASLATPMPLSLRALHMGRALQAPSPAGEASGGSGSGSGDGAGASGSGGDPTWKPPPAAPVQNPLQAALAEAAAASRSRAPTEAAEAGSLDEASRAAAATGRSRRGVGRTWVWYDESDEREERRKERQRQQYGDAGTTYMLDVPQSMKKMDRILKLIRGLPYDEAVAQCQLVPHKAAKYVLQALEVAREDAVEAKGLSGERLVVSTIFVTKGMYDKGMQPMGKGGSGRLYTRKSHLRVALTESDGRPPTFSARVVPPLMGTFSAAWGRMGAGAGAGGSARPRFAYRVEV